jgi:uncharacterized protein (DUF58 family)
MEGVLTGLHKSPHQGQSVEFAEHKEYSPGDEIKDIDWKTYGKFDKYYVKRYEHETNLRAFFLIDASSSMGYSSNGLSKLDVATTLAGALGYLLVKQQDAAGLCVSRGDRIDDIPARASGGHLASILDLMGSLSPRSDTDLSKAADHLAERLQRRSFVAVFSDLFDEHPEALRKLLQLRQRKHDLAVFHILDPAEVKFPFDDPTLFLSMEDERQLEVNAREIKKSYLNEFGNFLKETRMACAEADVDYELVRSDEALDQVLIRFLGRRRGGKR